MFVCVYLAAVIVAVLLVHAVSASHHETTRLGGDVRWLVFLVSYGLWRGRGSDTVDQFLLAGKTMPWYAMGLSIMATQASAITFISTTAQAYVDGMRFVQFYFGLPLAMVILSRHRRADFPSRQSLHRVRISGTALRREDTRCWSPSIFLISRGLRRGLALSAPAIVLSVILGWPFRVTILIMGGLVVLYTTIGGIKAVTWADVQQMVVILLALVLALVMAITLLPHDVSFLDAVQHRGRGRKTERRHDHTSIGTIATTLWSGLIGGMFLALAYFGTDQSQVQRYLTGKSIGQSRLGLLFNAMAKVPMQFFILFIGAMVFVFFLFVRPPLVFHPVAMEAASRRRPNIRPSRSATTRRSTQRQAAARRIRRLSGSRGRAAHEFRAAQKEFDAARDDALKIAGSRPIRTIFSFPSSRTTCRVGVVGLVLAVIFTAAMSAISGEINSLATVTVIDIYRRHLQRDAADRHYLIASRFATVFWGIYAVVFASIASGFGALIEAVNQVGSLFYGGMLGVFVLAFFVKRCTSTGAFVGVLAGEAAIFATARFTQAFLWYNVVGCLVTIAVAWILSVFFSGKTEPRSANPGGSLPGPA